MRPKSASITLMLLLPLAIRAVATADAQTVPTTVHSPGSDAWIRWRTYQLRTILQEVDKTDKRAAKRIAVFTAAEKLSRSQNETKAMTARRIAGINAQLKMRPMVDGGFEKEAEAIALTIVDQLDDPDFDLIKWWKPVGSKRLVERATQYQEQLVEEVSADHAALVSRLAKRKEELEIKSEKKKNRPSELRKLESDIEKLEQETTGALAELKQQEKNLAAFRALTTVPLYKICLEFKAKPNVVDGVAVSDEPVELAKAWFPQKWYFVMDGKGNAHRLTEDWECKVADSEFEKPDRRKK